MESALPLARSVRTPHDCNHQFSIFDFDSSRVSAILWRMLFSSLQQRRIILNLRYSCLGEEREYERTVQNTRNGRRTLRH